MRKLLPALLLPLACSFASAQVSLHIDIGLPVAPPLVEVQPGVQVVEGFDGEVFFCNGWYWCRRPDGWYRARSPRSPFGFVERRRVPGILVRVPEGHYRNWHHENDREWREWHDRGRGHHGDEDGDHDGDHDHGHRHGRDHEKHGD